MQTINKPQSTYLKAYGVAVLASILCVLFTFVFLPVFDRGTLHIFYIAVLIVAWRGGLGPALFTIAVGVLTNIFLLMSPNFYAGITAEDWLRVGIFIVASLFIAYIAYQLEESKRDLQKSLETERQNLARTRAVINGVNEALALVSPEQRIINVNKRFEEIFGIPRERVIGQLLSDTKTMFDQIFADADQSYELVLTGGMDTETTLTKLVRQNWPQARDIQLFSTPIRDEKGFLGRLFVFRDVTHEREVDRMKTEFVSLVSHELRTPLTSIKGFTELVLDGDAGEINEEVEEYLGIVLSNAERLIALVNDLLDISRIELGRVQLKSERVDLKGIVENVVATMQQKFEEKDQSLSVNIDPAATSVRGDQDKLFQVVMNYVSNAYKYTQAGGSIQIEVKKQDDLALVAVSDNGFGISPEDQARLFTRFYRVDNSMTREVGGTGLGLSIVKQLIELMGGEIGVKSALGEGSTFTFTVPLVTETTGEPVEVVPPASTSEATKPEVTIMVVEDDADIARLISHHLQKEGYQVHVARNAEEALTFLQEELPDLITLDLALPGLQGDEFAKKLQDDPLTRDIPILILSVYVDSQSEMPSGSGVMWSYALSKPIDQADLLTTVAQMLQPAQSGPVLVIDDDPDIRTLLSEALEKQGFLVETAPDGESGITVAEERQPSLILLDMRLPGMDGFAVLRALKGSERTANIPVIAMTGSSDLKTNARARLLALGASDFIAKPFDMESLVEEIRIFIKP